MVIISHIKQAGRAWIADHASYLAAAVAYHAIFSLAPLLIVMLSIVGLIYQQGSTQNEFYQGIRSLVGSDAAELIRNMLEGGKVVAQSRIAFLIGVGLTLLGSIGVFGQLQQAIHLIWKTEPPKLTIKSFLKRQLSLFFLVVISSLLLIVSLATSAILTRWNNFFAAYVQIASWVIQLTHLIVSFGLIFFLFAVLFKALPSTKIPWRTVWFPTFVTALLFTLGKYLLALYLGRGAVTSVYGAAGSLAGLLVWIFYATQIFLYGAELVKVAQPVVNQQLDQSELPQRASRQKPFIPVIFVLAAVFWMMKKERR